VFFLERFDDDWESRWVVSKHRTDGSQGEFDVSAGKFFNDAEEDKGLRTSQDAKFYAISAEMKEFSNRDKDLIIQYSVKHEQKIDCGGAYVKVFPASLNQEEMHGDSVYNIMFGPDICGSTKRTHVIFNYKGENKLVEKSIKCEDDEFSHLYKLVVKPDQTYYVSIDGKEVQSGNLVEDFTFLPPKEILDPSVSKPDDWVDEKEIDDPSAVKPEGYDDIPAQIADPDATKPDDWDDELDGEWEAPLVPNPDYKGEWKAPRVPNPEYKGEWVHPKIPNPDYSEDSEIYAYDSHKYVGFELWQVKSGTIFDNILITDDETVAKEFEEKFFKTRDAEKEASEKEQEEARERAKEEAEAAKSEVSEEQNAEEELSFDDETGDHHDHEHDEL